MKTVVSQKLIQVENQLAKAKRLRGLSAQYFYRNSNHRFSKLDELVSELQREYNRLSSLRREELIEESKQPKVNEPFVQTHFPKGIEMWYGKGTYNGD